LHNDRPRRSDVSETTFVCDWTDVDEEHWTVTVLYRKDPAHYVARFGSGRWLEADGWTLDEALSALAREIRDNPPDGIRPEVLRTDRDGRMGARARASGAEL
jgi:hypothetical protein